MIKQVDIIDYKNLAENLLNYLCDQEGITETIILLLKLGYSRIDVECLFPKDEVDDAIEEFEKTKEV